MLTNLDSLRRPRSSKDYDIVEDRIGMKIWSKASTNSKNYGARLLQRS